MGDVLSKLVQLKRITDVSLGEKPPTAGRFFVIFWKTSYLLPLDHNLHMFRAIRKTRFLALESQFKKLHCSILLELTS